MKIYEKLLKIQTELKCEKSQWNDFGKYNYRSCEDILVAVKPLLVANNLTLFFKDIVEMVGNRNYVKTELYLVDTSDNETLITTGYAREEETKKGMDGSQITGASSSYARKYALNGLFAIDDMKDSDTTNTTASKTSPQAIKPQQTTPNTSNTKTSHTASYSGLHCVDCDEDVSDRVAQFSKEKFGKVLCMNCQKSAAKPNADDGLPY